MIVGVRKFSRRERPPGRSILTGQEVTNGTTIREAGCATRRAPLDLPGPFLTAEGGPLNVATLKHEPTARSAVALDLAVQCAHVAEDNKARDIVLLDMREITPLYDFLLLCTGSSRRQIHTLAEEIDATLRAAGEQRTSIEGYEASKWIVQDYGDLIVHVFDAETREYYGLEDLWADAGRVDWARR
jgi:ribosome-associated protein